MTAEAFTETSLNDNRGKSSIERSGAVASHVVDFIRAPCQSPSTSSSTAAKVPGAIDMMPFAADLRAWISPEAAKRYARRCVVPQSTTIIVTLLAARPLFHS
jgi:hypothetical protein